MIKFLLAGASVLLWCTPIQVPGSKTRQKPQRAVTLVVHHTECTSCEDVAVDSGTVRIPSPLRQAFVDNQLKYRRWGPQLSRAQLLEAYASRGYEVTELDLSSRAAFDSLFSVPGRTITIYPGSPLVEYPWDFDRRYRITGQIIALDGRIPVDRKSVV